MEGQKEIKAQDEHSNKNKGRYPIHVDDNEDEESNQDASSGAGISKFLNYEIIFD